MGSDRMNLLKKMILFCFLACLLPFSLSAQSLKLDANEMANCEEVRVNDKELQKMEIKELITLLSNLKECEKEVYSKPDYVITYTKNGTLKFISVFKKEHFVYNGDYLDAWGTRMHGKASSGYKLSKKLLKYLSALD